MRRNHLDFLDDVDPERKMMPFDRTRLAEQARLEHYTAEVDRLRSGMRLPNDPARQEELAEDLHQAEAAVARSQAWLTAYREVS